MQNEETLRYHGFKKISGTDEWLYRGVHQKFTARLGFDGTFVELFLVSPDIDQRPLSDTKGKHFRSLIKDCCSTDSVGRALHAYDIPERDIVRVVGGVRIKSQ